MSYILEALKKAQAERQLGNSPTLHAPTLQSVDRSAAGGRFKKPLVLVIIAMAVVIAALAAMVLRSSRTPAEATAVQEMAGAPPASQSSSASGSASAPGQSAQAAAAESTRAATEQAEQAAQAASAPPAGSARTGERSDATAAAPLPAPVAALPPPVATLTPSVRKHAEPQPAQAASATPPSPAAPSNPASPAGQPAQTTPSFQAAQTAAPAANGSAARTTAGASPKPGFEEPVQNLRDLPEPIQRSIPQVAVGGYIYSKNAADRLLLIDKVLRREGEEVAPGLMLEKLNPKEAVFNFKGYRYRVPY